MVRTWTDLSVLIVGCGSIGRRHARVLLSLGVRDLRACDPLPQQREALGRESPGVRLSESYEAALTERPDVVLIATPPALHVPMAIAALRAGAHVLCEKPLSDTSRGLDELAALAARTGRQVMTALCFRFHEAHTRAKALLGEGRLGRLLSIRALMGEHLPDVRPDFRDLFTAKQGGAFDLTHEVDLALWYAGRPVTNVLCAAGTFSDIGIEAPDLVEMVVELEGPILASIHLDFFQRPRRRQMELMCTGGVIIIEFASWDRATLSVYDARAGVWTHEALTTERDLMFRAEDRAFLEAVAASRPAPCALDDARKSVEVIERAQAGFKAT